MIFDKHGNLKYKYGDRKFCARGYYASTVGLNEKTDIRDQEKDDIALDKLSVKSMKNYFQMVILEQDKSPLLRAKVK